MNALPDEVQLSIEGMLHSKSLDAVACSAKKLTEQYRASKGPMQALKTEEEYLAYLAFRLPATYAALVEVFSRLKQHDPEADLQSLLDLGAGPGTASLAAS